MSRSKKTRTVIPPVEGWIENAWYVIEVSYRDANPIHESLLFTGFLNDGEPTGYNKIVNPSSEDHDYRDPVFIRAIKHLHTMKLVRVGQGNNYKLPTDPDVKLSPMNNP